MYRLRLRFKVLLHLQFIDLPQEPLEQLAPFRPNTLLDVLIGKGLLGSEMRHDPRVVREALYAHLDQTLGVQLRVAKHPWSRVTR